MHPYYNHNMSSSPPPLQRRRRNNSNNRRRRRHAWSNSEQAVPRESRLDPTAPAFVNGGSGDSPPSTPLGAPVTRASAVTEETYSSRGPSEEELVFRESTKGTRFVLAWDIEKSGPRTDKHSMLAIGAVVLRVSNDKCLAKIRLFMKMEEGHDFSDICRQEYWYNWDKFPNNKHVLELIKKQGVSPREGIAKFAAWLDHQEKTYGKQLAVTTDNPASDATWVSHYFQKYLDRNPMLHPFGDEKRYRRLHHSNAYGRCLSLDDGSGGNWQQRLRDMGVEVPPEDLHDHDPLNDATWIAKLYTACIRHVRKQRYPHDRPIPEHLEFSEADRQQQAPERLFICHHTTDSGLSMRIHRNSDVPTIPNLAHPRPQASLAPFWQRPPSREQIVFGSLGNPGEAPEPMAE